MLLDKKGHLCLMHKHLTETSQELQDIPLTNPALTSLNLRSNQLTAFPKCLLQCKAIVSIDLRDNQFKDFEALIKAISGFPHIAELFIDFSEEAQVKELLNRIPQLVLINGQSTKDFISSVDIDDEAIDGISLKAFLPLVNSIFTKFQASLHKTNDSKEQSTALFIQFQSLINEEAQEVNSIEDDIANYSIANKVLNSQSTVMRFFNKKINEYGALLDNSDKDHITQSLFDVLFKIINDLSSILTKVALRIEATEGLRRNQIELLLQSLQLSINSRNEGGVSRAMQMHQNDKDFYLTKIERLENENKFMTEKLLSLGKQIASSTNSYCRTIDSQSKKASMTLSNSNPNSSPIAHTTNAMSFFNNTISSLSSLSVPTSPSIGITGAKVLSLNALKEIINEISDSKVEHDRRCKESNLPLETMEQHMYAHLNKKYGLRNLVIDWASSIINGIKMYSREDCDVFLFRKIIRNEIEEDARLVIDKVKSTINELIEGSIKAKAPFMPVGELKKAFQGKVNGVLSQEEWKAILYAVHSKEDAVSIENELLQMSLIDNDASSKRTTLETISAQERKLTREQAMTLNKQPEANSISYKAFIQCVCKYHIQYRVNYLRPFVVLYRKCDEDSDGIINESEFKSLIQLVLPTKDNLAQYTDKLLNVIDPFNNKRVSFTECTTLFSVESIKTKHKTELLSLLDYICTQTHR